MANLYGLFSTSFYKVLVFFLWVFMTQLAPFSLQAGIQKPSATSFGLNVDI